MLKVTLGRTGLEVSRLSMGGLFVASFGTAFAEAKRAVHRALELGVNYVDTAPTYADSEEVLGKCLDGEQIPFIISTKLGGRPKPFLPQDRDCLLKSVEESLRLLKRDQVDILYVHEPDRPGQYDWWTDYDRFTGPVLEVLAELKRSGVIKYMGIGGTSAYILARLIRTGQFDVVLTAFNYSLLWREAEIEIFPAAQEHNVGVVVGSPLQQGALARRYDDVVRRGARCLSKPRQEQMLALYKLCDEINMTLPELGLRFVISNPAVHTVLMGARSVVEVEQNVAAVAKGPLSKALLKKLDKIAAMVPFRPMDEPPGLGWVLPNVDAYKGPGML